MKISSNDQAIDSKLLCPWLTAFLDGKEMKYVVSADEEAGELTRHSIDKDGKPIWDGKDFALDTLKGKVEIRLRDDAPADRVKLFEELRALEAGL